MTAINEVCDYLKKCGTYYLATADGDQPRVRPFGTVHIFEDKLYIQTGRSKDVYQQLKANPRFEICGAHVGTWIRLTGELVEDARIEAQESLLAAYPSLQRMYAAGDGNTVVFYVKDGTATFCSFTEEPRTVEL